MHYLVYKLTNTINQKIYIGIHQTSNLNDGYMGSGTGLREAKKKYGSENFIKEVLFDYDNMEDMINKEIELVTTEFVKRKDNYNLREGGVAYTKVLESDYQGSSEHQSNVNSARLKAIDFHKNTRKLRIEAYNQNPNLCLQCKSPLLYEKKTNKFCTKSCSATHSNKRRVVTDAHKLKTSESLKARNKTPAVVA